MDERGTANTDMRNEDKQTQGTMQDAGDFRLDKARFLSIIVQPQGAPLHMVLISSNLRREDNSEFEPQELAHLIKHGATRQRSQLETL